MFNFLSVNKKKISFYAIVGVAILLGFQNCAPSNVDVMNVSVTEHPIEEKTVTTGFTLQLSERNYVAGVLADAFGPAGAATVRQYVLLKHDDLGGPCSMYAYYKKKVGTAYQDKDPGKVCDEENTTKQILPPPNAVRQGWMIQACSDLTGKDTNPQSLEYIFGKIQTGATLANPPALTDENLMHLHKLFYRERPLPPETALDALKMFFSEGGASIANWKMAINSYCISSHWQVL